FVWFALTEGLLALYAGYRYRIFRRNQSVVNNFAPMLRTTPAALEMRAPSHDVAEANQAQK
ncbi:MAG TPA: hypothetical protein VFN13_01735, partial [Rudaea sp.]|nr:hypothetical protein [Rudaea sp.]